MNVLKKILIVEDDQLLNRTLAYNLTSDGYEVISVFNFDSAVRKLRENEFDVALLDINLPDGSGLDLDVYKRQLWNSGFPDTRS